MGRYSRETIPRLWRASFRKGVVPEMPARMHLRGRRMGIEASARGIPPSSQNVLLVGVALLFSAQVRIGFAAVLAQGSAREVPSIVP